MDDDARRDGLRLRLLEAHDAPLYRALYGCPRVMAQVGPPVDAPAADAALARICRHNRREPAVHSTWAVEVPGAPACGIVSLDRRSGEIGLMLLPAAWNRRHAKDAIRAVLHEGFDVAGLPRIVANCREGVNVRLLRRLLVPFGFVRLPASRTGYTDWAMDRGDWRP